MQSGVNGWLVGSLLWMAACADTNKGSEVAFKANNDAPNTAAASPKNAEPPTKSTSG